MAPEKSKSEQLEKKVREIAPEKADSVLERYQKVQEGLHDALYGEGAGENISAAQAGMQRLEEMEDELLAKGAKREALVTNFDAELGSIADSLGIGLRVEAAIDAVDKEAAEKDVKYYFGQIDANLHDFFDSGVASKDRFIQAYMKRGSRPRTDAKTIYASFNSTIPYFHQADETERTIVKDSYGNINKALMLFVNGQAAKANKILWGIKTQIDGAKIIEADLLPKLKAEKEKMAAAQAGHLEACAAMRKLVEEENGGDPIRKAQAQEKMLETYRSLLKDSAGFAKLRENIVVFGPNGEDFRDEREKIFVRLVGEDVRSIKSMSVKIVEVETKVVNAEKFDPRGIFTQQKEKTIKVPKLVARSKKVFVGDTEELEGKIEDNDLALLSVRRDLFLMTGDGKYKEAFDKGQEKINQDAKTAALEGVEEAEDGTPELTAEVNKEIELMAIQFAEIQNKQAQDPLEAMKSNSFFLKYLYDLRERLGRPMAVKLNLPMLHPLASSDVARGTSFDQFPFENLEEDSPALHEAFVGGIDRYINISHQMQVADIFGKDRVFVKHIKGMVDFAKETKSFIDDFSAFMEAEESDNGKFSEERMGGIRHRVVAFRLGTKTYADAGPMAEQVFDRLREYESLIVGIVPGFEKEFLQFQKQMDAMEKLRVQTCQVMNFLDQAEGETQWTWSWENVRDYLSKLAAGVVVAVAFAAVFVGTGGGVLALVVVGAAAGAGGYIGWVGQSQLIDDRPDKFTLEGLGTTAAFGAAFGVAGRFIGQPFGKMVGRFAQRTNVKLAALTPPAWMGGGGKIVVDMLRKFGERGLNRQAAQLMNQFAQHGLAREIPKEFLQEIFDDILAHLGKVIAPHHPWVGFMFQVLAAGMYHAKTVKINATFAINEDVTVSMTDSSVSFEFSDKARALDALRQHGAPAEVIAAFEANGLVNAVKDGVTIIVRPSNEPVVVRQLLANQKGQNAALLAGLRFNEADPATGLDERYTFEGSPEMLIAKLEGEFLVETTPDGDIIATDLAGNKIRFTFANKHLGLEVAGLLHYGLELDANRQPTITRAENVLPVLGQLTQMGFTLVQSPNGIMAKKDGQKAIEIQLNEAIAAEVAEGGREILELAAALNEDTDGFGARMLTKLNGAKDKVGEALLWATTKIQVELQSLMGRISRAIDARAGRSAAANLAVPGGLSLLTSGCSVEGATEWYLNKLVNNGLTSTVVTILVSKMILNGGATWILHALVPKGALGKFVGNAIWLPIKGMWLLGKYAFSGKFKEEIDSNQPGVNFDPGKSPPTKADLRLDNLNDLSHESQAEFDTAFNQLKAVFKAIRFAAPTITKKTTGADGKSVTETVPDIEAGRAKGQEMFNDIMGLIYMSLRRADIQNGRTSPQPQPQQAEGRGWSRQSRTAPPARSSLSPAQELAFIGNNLETGLQTLLTQPLTDLQALTVLESVQTTAIDQAMKMVDGFLTSKDIDPTSPQGKSIKAEVTRLFKLIAELKPASKHRQLAVLEARRDALKPLKEKAEAIVKGFDELVAQNRVALTAQQKAIYDAAKADIDRYNDVDSAYGSLKRKLGNIRNKLRVLLPESPKSKAIVRAAFFVALMTAIGFAGNAVFGGDDEEVESSGAAGGQPGESTSTTVPGDATGARTEKAAEDKATVDGASEGTSEALNESLERLKRDYLEALRKSKDANLTDVERKYAKADAEYYDEMLRKHGIDPDSLNKAPKVPEKATTNKRGGADESKDSRGGTTTAPDSSEPAPADPPAEPVLPSGPQGRDLLR